ncbi:MAG: hypothetical protein ACYSUT_04870 [Planctomycetota bacterium]|jgi:hypothetical protein
MERHRLIVSTNRKRRGNTLVLIIIIALFAVGAAMFLNSVTSDPTGPVEQCPWCETQRITRDFSSINLPQESQIKLEEEMAFNVSLKSDEGDRRGKLRFIITPDGIVEVLWTAKYKEGGLEKEFTASMVGNVDATMLHEGDEGIDESKLFFITEGTFLLQAFKHGNARAGGGEAYVVGWLGADKSAHGTLVLAPNKKNTKIYEWDKPGT